MSGPGPMALAQAVADILSPLSTAGRVVVDPLYLDPSEADRYPGMVATAGPEAVRGWLVMVESEEPESPLGSDGYEQLTTLALVAMLSATGIAGTASSRQAFDTMITDAKDALRALPALGIVAARTSVRTQLRLYSPLGYFTRKFKEHVIHSMPGKMQIWVKFC